jgi:hypothetical protein
LAQAVLAAQFLQRCVKPAAVVDQADGGLAPVLLPYDLAVLATGIRQSRRGLKTRRWVLAFMPYFFLRNLANKPCLGSGRTRCVLASASEVAVHFRRIDSQLLEFGCVDLLRYLHFLPPKSNINLRHPWQTKFRGKLSISSGSKVFKEAGAIQCCEL